MSISLSNGHARATVLSAVWSPVDQQLVAVLMAATDKTVLTALKAELEKNNKNSFVSLAGEAKADLAGARRGYVHLTSSLDKTNAQGHVMALLHWRAHDPRHVVTNTKPAGKEAQNSMVENSTLGSGQGQAVENDYFYVVSRQGDCLPTLFIERLQLALAWALRPEWAEPLLQLGKEAELVDYLPVCPAMTQNGPFLTRQVRDGSSSSSVLRDSSWGFRSGLRFIQDEDRWGDVIGSALSAGTIRL